MTFKNKIFIIAILLGISSITYYFSIRICPFFAIFHVPCPGCGMTRSFVALLHLDIVESLKYNLLTMPVILLLTLIIFSDHTQKINDFLWKHRKTLILTAITITAISWGRNLINPLMY